MNTVIRASIAAAALLSVSITACESEKKTEPAPAAAKPLTLRDSVTVVVTATVKSINYINRQVSLQDAAGYTMHFVAGPQVQRLNEVKVGDTISVEYNASLVAELRAPTPEEAANPLATIAVADRTPDGAQPGAGAGSATRIVTTVQAVDLANMLVTLKGPMGDTTTVRARSAENIKKLHVGDTIVITYSEGVAVSVSKPTAK